LMCLSSFAEMSISYRFDTRHLPSSVTMSIRQLATALGISPGRVHQLIHSGMPSTLAEAVEWRSARKTQVGAAQAARGRIVVNRPTKPMPGSVDAEKPAKKRLAPVPVTPEEMPEPVPPRQAEVNDKGPRGAAARMRLAEVKHYSLWVAEINKGGTVAEIDRSLRSYTHASDQRMVAEIRLDAWRENRGELIRAQAAIKLFREAVQELVPAMRNAPDRYAARVNPENADVGRRGLEALRAELGEAVGRASATLAERLGPEARVDE